MQKPTFNIITVCFSGELDLLRLQARSLDKFFPAQCLSEIDVIVNDINESGCIRLINELLPEYGQHRKKVRVIPGSGLLPLRLAGKDLLWQVRLRLRKGKETGWKGHEGWFVQQALKLRAATLVKGTHALILDAKNHFLNPVGAEDLVTADGRARSQFLYYEKDDRKHVWLASSFAAFGLPAPDPMLPHPPTVTPIVIQREVFKAALRSIERRLGPLDLFFIRKRRKETEFFLIYAAVEAKVGPWTNIFGEGLISSGTIFRSTSDQQIEEMFSLAEAGKQSLLGVHRARVNGLTSAQTDRLEAIWQRAGLLRSGEHFRDFFPKMDPVRPS